MPEFRNSPLLCTRICAPRGFILPNNVQGGLIQCFVVQYYPALPPNVQKIMSFVDLAPLFRKLGREILEKQMHLITVDLMEVRLFIPNYFLSFSLSYPKSVL